jgi:hypothetical protein
MILDLRTILEGWEYEPGKISVRKIIGTDGREKIQTRVDLGLLQFEVVGRPDGQRPHGCDSLLEYCETRLREHSRRGGSDAGFTLSADECRELRYEAHLYYQRYLSHFVLEEFEAVERDTARNLRLLDFCRRYASADGDRDALENQRAYVLMMNARARTYGALKRNDFAQALEEVEAGIEEVRDVVSLEPVREDGEDGPELQVLSALREEVVENMPGDAEPRLKLELQAAIDREDYEQAAQLRDRLAVRQRRGDAA